MLLILAGLMNQDIEPAGIRIPVRNGNKLLCVK
jgi:hypothetical protein